MHPTAIPVLVEELEAFYRREGYYFVEVVPEVDRARSQLTLRIEEGPKVRVGDIEFVGNEEFADWTFLGVGTDLAGELELGDGFLFFPGSAYDEEAVQRDLVAIEQLYRDYGYLEARARLESKEFYGENSRVALTFHVYEGPRYHVREVHFRPAGAAEGLQVSEEELLDVVGLAPGQPLERARIAADGNALRRFYGARGHPAGSPRQSRAPESFFAFNPPDASGARRSGEPELVFDVENHLVDVIYVLQEGRPMRVRDVVIQGNTSTQDRVIRREISLEPGDPADGEQAVRSWRRLIGLTYFQDPDTRAPFVDWEFQETEREGWVDLRFEVAEGQTGRLLFGGGINTNTGPFLSATILKENFDLGDPPSSAGDAFSEVLEGTAFTGAGQSLRLFLAPGLDFSQYTLSFTEPDLFGDHIDRVFLNTRGFKTFFFLDTHEEVRTGGSIRLGRRFGRFTSLYLQPESQRVEIQDVDAGAPPIVLETEGRNRLNAITLGFSFNTVEDPFSPVDGGSIGVEHRRAGGIMGGEWDFEQTTVSGARYFELWEDSLDRPWVLALEGRVGIARETGDLSTVPYSERFFLGGQNSLRGFDFRGVGPRSTGFPLGGEAFWSAATEIRFPLLSQRVRGNVQEVEYIRGAVFMDWGSLGDSLGAVGPTRISAGVGLRIRIPFLPQMPLALDFGWPVQKEPLDDARVFSFTFGNF